LEKSLVLQDNGMAARSLTATPAGIQQINRALTDRGWSREDLAKECDCSRQPAINFASGKKAVSKKLFVSFCNALKLNWEAVSGQQTITDEEIAPDASPDLGNLVQTVRGQVHADIQKRCGTMRVLDMEQPIGLGDIYTSVNILKKLSKNQRPPRGEWLKHDPENFDRFLLGQVHQPRIPGLQAVEEHCQLMILGKPGAGKTTFMKRLAILCNEGEFQPQRVPIFVPLKEYAENEDQPKLQAYIQNQWETCGVKEADALESILKAGQALILLDGLDEVKESDHDRVLNDIKNFTQIRQIQGCQCVMTCRADALEYMFDSFTYVEIADFDKDQIVDFSAKWFAARQDQKKAKIFIEKLNQKDNEPLRKLAVTPILLTLLCLTFEETSEFPKNRSEFYQQGVNWLLKKWDDRRGIKRDVVYKRLSLPRKKEMLSQFAFETFERGDYFFKKSTVEQYMIRYIRSLPGASEDEDILHLDEEAVLKSITAQHGLLIERARGLYSFSHLTFQEYFTAQHIVNNTNSLNQALESLAAHVTDKRYREIFLLTAEMLPKADLLLLLMKQKIDLLTKGCIYKENHPQGPLNWLNHKTKSIKSCHDLYLIRSVYYACLYSEPYIDILRKEDLGFDLNLDISLISLLNSSILLKEYMNEYEDLVNQIQQSDNPYLDRDVDFGIEIELSRVEMILGDKNPCFHREIKKMQAEIPTQSNDVVFLNWWNRNGRDWVERLRHLIIVHRNLGHDWQFSETQKEKLKQYYDANNLLVACLDSDCYVTKATRQYIEDTLLLPLSEIEKYPVPDAIANLYPNQPEMTQ
jgi:predicted NACHT family NTPase